MINSHEQNQFFENFLQGIDTSLSEIFDLEKPMLFDFLLRMTGRFDDSMDCVYEAFRAIEKKDTKWKSLAALRMELYIYSRSNLSNIWDANTSKLENMHIDKIIEDNNSTQTEIEDAIKQQKLDKAVSNISPHRREVALLNCRLGFSLEDTSEIMDISVATVATEVSSAITIIEENGLSFEKSARDAIRDMEYHVLPERDTLEITDLQELIVDIKKEVPGRFKRVAFWFLIISITCILYLVFIAEENIVQAFFRSF